jgi:putative peptidoglycan lipid II flippase
VLSRWKAVKTVFLSRIAIVGGLIVFIKVLGAAKELVVAKQFGLSQHLDAFFVAFSLAGLVIGMVAGAFNSALIPTYIQVRCCEGEPAAQRLFGNVTLISLLIAVAASVLLVFVSPHLFPYLAPGFSRENLETTHWLFICLVPMIVISGSSSIWVAVLNAREHFEQATIVPGINPIVTLLVLLLIGKAWGIYGLAVGMVAGTIVEAVFLALCLKRHGLSGLPRWSSGSSGLTQVMKQYAPSVADSFIGNGAVFVEQFFAAMIGPGSIAALNYGKKLVAFLVSIGVGALATTVLPLFSRLVAQSDWLGLKRVVWSHVRLTLLFSLPMMALLMIFSEPIVRLLFERGAFTAENTVTVSQLNILFAIQIPFYLLSVIGSRLIMALKANTLLMYNGILNVLLTGVFNYLFVQLWGLGGIALSASATYACSLLYGFIVLYFLLGLKARFFPA